MLEEKCLNETPYEFQFLTCLFGIYTDVFSAIVYFCFLHIPAQLIFTGEYTIAMNKSWHLGHFRCNECDTSITGKQFIVRDEKPVCVDCFDQRCVTRLRDSISCESRDCTLYVIFCCQSSSYCIQELKVVTMAARHS